jgi:hypothetical protein
MFNFCRSSNRVITQQPQRDFGRDANNAIRHSRILVEQYEDEAKVADPHQRDKLLSAARSVAQATSNMISATEHAQSRPQEAEAQMALKSAAEHLVQVGFSRFFKSVMRHLMSMFTEC